MSGIPRSGRGRFITPCRYLTARCPGGCESWLHPRAVETHVNLGRCRGKPWVDDVEDSALVPQPAAVLFGERLPAVHIRPFDITHDTVLRLRSGERMRYEVLQGIVVRSPLEGVPSRRWVYTVMAAVKHLGP